METQYIFTTFFIFIVIIMAVIAVFMLHQKKVDETTRYKALSYMPKPFLSHSQKEFYKLIKQALPQDFSINMATPLTSLLEPFELEIEQQALHRDLQQQNIDFIVMNAQLEIVCLIDIDDRDVKTSCDHASRDLLNRVGYPTISYDLFMKPTKEKIQEDILKMHDKLQNEN